jgi:hypothetical protein
LDIKVIEYIATKQGVRLRDGNNFLNFEANGFNRGNYSGCIKLDRHLLY